MEFAVGDRDLPQGNLMSKRENLRFVARAVNGCWYPCGGFLVCFYQPRLRVSRFEPPCDQSAPPLGRPDGGPDPTDLARSGQPVAAGVGWPGDPSATRFATLFLTRLAGDSLSGLRHDDLVGTFRPWRMVGQCQCKSGRISLGTGRDRHLGLVSACRLESTHAQHRGTTLAVAGRRRDRSGDDHRLGPPLGGVVGAGSREQGAGSRE